MKTQKSGMNFGLVSFSGLGGFQEKMLSELLADEIRVYGVRFADGKIYGAVSPFDYYRTAETARKYGVKLRAGERRGLYFTLLRYRRRIGLYMGFMVFAAMLSIMQTRVQDISITGDVRRAQVLNILEECGITVGAATSSLNTSRAEQKLMLEVENCAWADVSCVGFRVNVRVEKGVEKPEIEDDKPRNIVAARPAQIVRQIVRDGASVVNNGSGVNTGDMLVSGTVPDGRDKVLFVRSDAEIIGEWSETREFFVPYTETVSAADGDKKVFKWLILDDDEYPLFLGKAAAENSLYVEETSVVRLFGQETSLLVRTGTFTEYTEKTVTRSPEAAAAELKKQKENFEKNFYSDYEIIDVDEMYYPAEDGVRLVLEYTLQGDIAKPVVIEYDNVELPPVSIPPAENSAQTDS
ncbi:MAG: sporulation protein YqfD [Lachnospiraceae bacterium]|nr:sporulation protein YqfD [Ruminococcus sp.]MCM1276548.1 sporulation protein YqfD [Lachnospiraceae bacterium]